MPWLLLGSFPPASGWWWASAPALVPASPLSISRRIGAKDKSGADNAAMHAMLLAAGVSVVLTESLLFFLKPMRAAMGAGASIDLALEFGNIVFAGRILWSSPTWPMPSCEGLTSPGLNALRDVVLVTMTAFVLGMIFGIGEKGIWWGIVFGNISGRLLSYFWARLYISRVMKDRGLSRRARAAA